MIINGIDYPNQIIDAIRDGSLVVFAGAGASMGKPTYLPDFRSMARRIAKGTSFKLAKNEKCEVFLGTLSKRDSRSSNKRFG